MKKIGMLLLAMFLGCVTYAQDYDKYIKITYENLEIGNYENAKTAYEMYVGFTGQTIADIENLLKNDKQNVTKQEGFIDLGLPSGTKWSSQNESQRYSFETALKTFSLSALPSEKQWQELSDYCNWEWYECNGIYGYVLTSKFNGNSIFLPANFPYSVFHVNEDSIWASSLEIYSDGAFFSGCVGYSNEQHSIRLVLETPYLSKSMTGQSDETFELQLQNAKITSQQEYDEVLNFNQPVDEETIIIPVGNTQIQMKHVKGGNFKGRVPDLGVDCQRATAKEWTLYDLSVKDYYIATTEVTQELWEIVMREPFSEYLQRLPSRVEYLNGYDLSVGGLGPQHPVYYVSSDDVREFIMRLNQLTGKNFRLPTTREWIFAESGGNESLGFIYSGSNDIDKIAWYGGNSYGKTHPVASKLPNELGLYDFTGNVMEWTQCDYRGTTIYGSWYMCEKEGCLLGDNWRAIGHFKGVGFRLAMDYTP